MSTLVITKSYSSGNILTEAMLDHFRDGLLTLFNTDKLSSTNFAAMALTSSQFSTNELTTTDATYRYWGTDSDCYIGTDASKNLVFGTVDSGTSITFTAVTKSLIFGATLSQLPGEPIVGSGGSTYGLLHLVSRYRKPVLVYASSSTISLENNTGTTNQTLIAFPSYVIAVTEALAGGEKYRKMNILSSANGYDSTHTGSASGGHRADLTITANTWYAIYAVRVRYGTNAGNKFIMVADDIMPSQANEATLTARYGDGQWVYIGLVRYGFGVVGSTTSIVPFVQTNKGWVFFSGGDGSTASGGLTLAQSSANADDTPFYTVVDSMSGASIPCDAIKVAQFNMVRSRTSDWTIRDPSDVVLWRGGYPDPTLGANEILGHLVTTNVEASTDFCQVRVTTGAVDKRIIMTSFVDKYINCRRHGHGI